MLRFSAAQRRADSQYLTLYELRLWEQAKNHKYLEEILLRRMPRGSSGFQQIPQFQAETLDSIAKTPKKFNSRLVVPIFRLPKLPREATGNGI
ncbi:MAG: hypothetical protein ABSB42_07490 [Tepidisphaeraceae bacterium]|jgi:hypothetical protein